MKTRSWCLFMALAAAAFVDASPLVQPAAASPLAAPIAMPAADRALLNGGVIAFEQEAPTGDHTQTDILTVRSDGTDVEALTSTPNLNEFGAAWTPDGGRIAFWRTPAPFGPGSLWVMAADGTHQRRLTRGVDARDPSWSPDAARIVYDRAAGDLYTLRASDGQDRVRLTSGPPLDFEPAWSPDGKQVAFTRGSATGDPGDLYLLTLATRHLVRVTHSAAYDHQVAWAPAGHRLVFERDFDSQSSIFTIKPDGTDLVRLTTGPFFDVGPAYSPDAKWIAFGSDRGDTLDNLWVMRANGADEHPLLTLPNSQSFPTYRP